MSQFKDILYQSANGILTRDAVDHITQCLAEEWRGLLLAGQAVMIPGIGKVYPAVSKARTARNPKTGEAVSVPERTVVKFKAGSGGLRG